MALLRCKPCGFIIEESELEDVCPACGASNKVFEPYTDKMSPQRRQFLNFDMHPIAVHFPQSILVFLILITLINIMYPNFKAIEIFIVTRFFGLLLPLSVAGAFVSGIIDGKIRFKKLKTPALTKKIILGSLMLLCSSATTYFIFNAHFESTAKIIVLCTSIVTIALAVFLAQIGKKLMYAEMPG